MNQFILRNFSDPVNNENIFQENNTNEIFHLYLI
jgi:hypothetical protein